MPDYFTLSNPKMMKGQSRGYLSAVLHLSPAETSGVLNTCPKSTEGCRAACLNTAGRGGIFAPGELTNPVQEARRRRTREYVADRGRFVDALCDEITRLKFKAARQGLTLCVRPNGTSDLPGLALALAMFHPDVQFYDYTKIPRPWKRALPNYHLTFSRSESNAAETLEALKNGASVAVVFDTPKGQPLPTAYLGRPVFDGDETDLRFLDPPEHIIGLRAKGRAKRDCSGFVVRGGAL
jgi:ABC-type amino acid transport substrate-binding protein